LKTFGQKKFFFSLYCTNACAKECNMQKIPGEVNEVEARVMWSGNAGRSSKRKERSSFAKIAGEKERAKADRILEDLEESCQRMGRLLRVFDRMA
jgi:hypothetical protein